MNIYLSRDPQLSSVTRNCQIYSMQLDNPNSVVFFFQIKRIPEFYHSKEEQFVAPINAHLFLQTFLLEKNASLISLLTRAGTVEFTVVVHEGGHLMYT